MFSRSRIPAIITALCATLLIAGCSSSGTVAGSGSPNTTTGALTGGTSGGSGGNGGNDSTDAGCSEATSAIQNAMKAENTNDVPAGLKVATTSIAQLRDAAQTTQKPGGKDAMNKVADDLQAVVTQVQSGQQPSIHQALADAQSVMDICGA
ncbi:hypothetical protein ABH926_005210 [Catenulispora sp. GP43]|uniref:hypothetical protein n=1 Tax=Catenulispora sp. GP43 TaxID=3156263 RepID=UPI003519AD86